MSRRAGARPEAPSTALDPAAGQAAAVGVKRLEIVCSAPYQQSTDHLQRTYVVHPLFRESGETLWPDKTDACCFHCLDQFEGRPVFLPMDYRADRREYVGFGIFHWFSCAKRYAIEHPNYNSPNQMTWLAQLARDMGVKDPIIPAPPQIRLKKLGGDLPTDKFRELAMQQVQVVVREPPFITWAMVFEERRKQAAAVVAVDTDDQPFPAVVNIAPPAQEQERWQVTGLRAPVEPAVGDVVAMDLDMCQPATAAFDQFLEQKKQASAMDTPAPPPAIKGSAMKTTGIKRRKAPTGGATKAGGGGETISGTNVQLPTKPAADSATPKDTKRGSLRAFMKQRTAK